MRLVVTQLMALWLGLSMAFPGTGRRNTHDMDTPIYTNNIQRFVHRQENKNEEIRALKRVFLSNRSVTCNDGSQAGFYLRKSYTSKKWIIFLEGGWYCYDHHSCRNRWLKQRHYMTSTGWPDARDIGGILSGSMEENPFWWNANHVFIPYCTSDSWSGSKPHSRSETFSFMGSILVQQVVQDLLTLGLENSTDLLLTGSSAGGTGVMLNLDPVREFLHDKKGLRHIVVKGVTDSGWFLDRTPYAPTLKPAVDAIRRGIDLWGGKVPHRCKELYPDEPWRCYFGYRLYPTLKTELFVFQWLFDEAQMDADNVGAPVTKQQWDYIHKMGDALRQSFENVSAVFAPSCISHSVLTKRDWQNVKIDDISIPEALHCWEQKLHRRRIKKSRNTKMFADQPKPLRRQTLNSTLTDEVGQKKKRRRKNRKSRKGKKKKDAVQASGNRTSELNLMGRPQRSVLHTQRRKHCTHRRLERCSWPQCNHSCPRLHNPFTGEEMDFIELLKSFGLDMESVAKALGIDMQTLNNMDHSELLNLLTQQSN
ncbi:palmitoleoyl-protein carboxylesterase NOTUM isoform X1 [Tribolium castaneum]|uniref:Protein notum homolog-like Protein n=1 Tax=Tribolium castaneum TaxID=7070 RepID=D6WAN4_TRICA|nr:PREDICTED: palmitoleoyl-protein carboxylesterase NOTUM [Tribolium castaneum]EEZ98657.1 Protein notum homolog-like Protein [Tribolium castaneum]|eukprot:XP_015840864.1 PREDICTED: palmitoleoyl-protein carboxylesterase NOTUM [Tribolium castaneum]